MSQVSVLMTVWNGMPYVKEALESLFTQTFQDFCAVIVDNGSNDDFADYISQLPQEQRNKLNIISLPANIGRTPALNLGLSHINTPYTAVLDADDVCYPERFAKQVSLLNANPNIALVGSHLEKIDTKSQRLGFMYMRSIHNEILEAMPLTNQFLHSACMYRTDIVKALGGYPEKYVYAQDLGLWIEILAKGHNVASIPEILVAAREHAGQETQCAEKNTLRITESIDLAVDLASVPTLSRMGQQAALIRAAIHAASIRKWYNVIQLAWKAATRSPLTLLTNPIIWKRFTTGNTAQTQ